MTVAMATRFRRAGAVGATVQVGFFVCFVFLLFVFCFPFPEQVSSYSLRGFSDH